MPLLQTVLIIVYKIIYSLLVIRSNIGEDLFAIALDQPFRFPATFTFVLRAFSTLEGIGKRLDDSYRFSVVATPYFNELLAIKVTSMYWRVVINTNPLLDATRCYLHCHPHSHPRCHPYHHPYHHPRCFFFPNHRTPPSAASWC